MLKIMKLNKLKQIIKEEIQKLQTLNEAELVTSVEGEFDKYGDIYKYKCTYCCDSNGMSFEVYTNSPCSDTYGSAPGGGSSNSSDLLVPAKITQRPVRPQRPTRAPRADKRPGGSRPMPFNPRGRR